MQAQIEGDGRSTIGYGVNGVWGGMGDLLFMSKWENYSVDRE